MDKLMYFVTPDDEQILLMNRAIVSASEDSGNHSLQVLSKAKLIFESLRDKGIRYHPEFKGV